MTKRRKSLQDKLRKKYGWTFNEMALNSALITGENENLINKDIRYLSASLTFKELETSYNIAKEKRVEAMRAMREEEEND